MLGLSVNYRPKEIETILASLKPNASQPEAVPWVMYDTQKYVAAGSTTLSFFTTLPNPLDKTLTNMNLAGALPNPQYFEIQKVYFDVLNATTTSATTAGAADDIAILLNTARGIATFTLSDKQYGPFPLTFFGGSGGCLSMVASAIATPGTAQQGIVRDNGGFPENGALIIPPQTQFSWNLTWVAGSAITADTYVRMSMLGVLYRRVS